ncbi:MAG: hemN [Gammaproteobacteria bacterium]|nr:hemN [Gammaproteobacteria bacterium]
MSIFAKPIPLSLYIHIPWCVRKCPYCDFNSHEARETIPEAQYVTALLQDLDENLPAIEGRRIHSVFLGGGTPSLFSPDSIDKILTGVRNRVSVHPDTEITLEANPGTIDETRFIGFRQAGVNRLSLGIQSLQDDKLKALGRIHNRAYALRAIESARQAGFDNFNLDLMHGLPGQSLEDALSDLRDALFFNPPHLSWYQLTLEPNTFFYHQPPRLPEEEILWEIQEQGKALLIDAGLSSYEVSAYAKPTQYSRHNRNYWEFGDYLGIGAGAHSKITDSTAQVITRHWQVKNPKDYLGSKKKWAARVNLARHDICFEFMLNALRLTQGVPACLFSERTGLAITSLEPTLTIAKERKLLVDDPMVLCTTELGQRFLNDTISLFLPKKTRP